MELKEYIKIFREDIKLFLAIILVIVMASFAYFALRSISYSSSLVLNITRSGVQQTADYRYDDFYRLQADDKFAETVVEWLKNPRIVSDIYAKSGIGTEALSLRKLSKIFAAEKRSSQVVSVSFSTQDEKTAEKISKAIFEVISENTKSLNKNQNESTWFEIVAQSPVVVQDKVASAIIFLASMALGVFLAFWVVMIRHYLK